MSVCFEQYMYLPNGLTNAANVVSGNSITATLLGYGTNERASAAAVTQVTNNTFAITSGGGSTGVQMYNIYKTGGIALTNNTITGADTGVYAFINGGSATITGGSISGGVTGIHLTNYLTDFTSAATDPGSLTVTGTSLTGNTTGILVEDDTTVGAEEDVTLTLGGGVSISGGTTGIRVTGDNAKLGGLTLGNTSFTGQTDYVVLENNAMDNLRIVGTSASFGGVIAPTTLAQNFAIENKLTHGPDNANVGFIVVRPGFLYVTTPGTGTTDEKIQNAIDVAVSGETIHVQAGTFVEDITVNKTLSILGPNAGISAQTGVRNAEAIIRPIADNNFNSAVVAIAADNVLFDGFRVVVDRAHASAGIAASYSAISDINNLTGGSFNNLQLLNNFVMSSGLNVGDFDLDPVSTLSATSMGIALVGMGSPIVYSVTIQGNQVLATPELGDPAGVSAFTRGIYLGAVQGTVGGTAVSQGNTATGFAQDLLVQFAGGATTIRRNRFIAAGVDISAPAAPVTITQNTFAPDQLLTTPLFPSQSLLIRNATVPVTVTNNTFDDFHRGIVVEGGTATISNNTFENIKNPFATDVVGLGEAAITVQTNGIASIIGNTFGAGIETGVDVDGGIARIQANTFSNDLTGVLVQNAGKADIGQLTTGTEFSPGLGRSTGGNNFTAFTLPASPSQGAIVVLKNNAPNNLAGSQGIPNDTPAFGNTWNASVSISDVVYDDADDASLG